MDEELPPDVRLLVSMRSIGYSFDDAIADLIDNSITAGAETIDITGDPVAGAYVVIADDGQGMTREQALQALQFAGSVVGRRDEDDLGRFGLGLKTASLSQGKRLSIITRRDGETTVVQWDIDHVTAQRKWMVRVLDAAAFSHIPEVSEFDSRDHGTMVIWEELDVLIGDTSTPAERMASMIGPLHDHLSLVFHRFLDGSKGTRQIKLIVNRVQVKPLDPFLTSNQATQVSPVDSFKLAGEKVRFQSFVLPHQSKLTPAESTRRDLGQDMSSWQGFYFYRGDRLINWGGWHGAARRHELAKHTRIRVDFPNTLDHLWQLDIKKSRVAPPREFLQRYRGLVSKETSKSVKVQKHRGRQQRHDSAFIPLWSTVTDRFGSVSWEVNAQHPVIKTLLGAVDGRKQTELAMMLRDLGHTLPLQDIYLSIAEGKTTAEAEYSKKELIARIRQFWDLRIIDRDITATKQLLGSLEPFTEVDDLETLITEARN